MTGKTEEEYLTYLTRVLEGIPENEEEAIFEVIMAENFKLTHGTKCLA